ncbi:hypothetical protein LG314_08445 [Agrococcus terreus]|uniref:hypothetical protein n=1 Tax=Agrococcus terreus TaxID=574649 RepID=UPI00384AFCCC
MTAHDDLRPELERRFAGYGDALGPMDAPATAALRAMPGLMVTAEDAWRIHVAALAVGEPENPL